MKNSADLEGCYPPRPTASVDNTLLDLQNSSYPTQPHSIIAKYAAVTTKGALRPLSPSAGWGNSSQKNLKPGSSEMRLPAFWASKNVLFL